MTDLDQAQLERKICLLSLTTMAFQNIGRDLPYSSIAEVLQVEPSQVERWVIDGKSMLNASACNGTYRLSRSAPRWSRRRQALTDLSNIPRYPRFSARIRAQSMGGTGEAVGSMEGGPCKRTRSCRGHTKEDHPGCCCT